MRADLRRLRRGLPDRQTLQLYVQGTPLELETMLAEEAYRCEQAASAAAEAGEHARAAAIRRLGQAEEQSIRQTAARVAPLEIRYKVVCPFSPAGRFALPRSRRRTIRVAAEAHERAMP